MTSDKPTSENAAGLPAANADPILSVRDLRTYFRVEGGIAKAVDGVSFDVYADEVLGIVGESGSGKSVSALSVMRLIPDPPGFIAGGEIWFEGRNLLAISHAEMRDVRGNEIGMIFQEPMTALNPVFTIGMQVMEAVRTHMDLPRREVREHAIRMLDEVGIPDAAKRLKDYPHQFSGGMRQRVMIAMALACNPQLLIADEPTTALDVTTQAQILELMLELKRQHAQGSIILITHDLAVVAETCDRVIVMYGGKLQETGTVDQIFNDPRHPYTKGLLDSLPSQQHKPKERLHAIPGNVPSIMDLPEGCKFCTRCEEVLPVCESTEPPMYDLGNGHLVRCHLMEDAVK